MMECETTANITCPQCKDEPRLPLWKQSDKLLTCVCCRAQYPVEPPGIAHLMPSEEIRKAFAVHEEHWNNLPPDDYEESCRRLGSTLDAIDAVHLHHCGGDVLEVGCGSGRFLNKLAKHSRVRSITGLDVSLSMLRRSGAQGHVSLVHSPAETLPFLTASFDSVASTWSALKYVDREKGFAEIQRVLRPGGMFTFDLINHWPYWLDYVWREYLSQYRLPPRGLARNEYILASNMRDARREVSYLENAGFELIEMRSVPYLPFLRRRVTQLRYWNGYWGSRIGYDTIFVCRKMPA